MSFEPITSYGKRGGDAPRPHPKALLALPVSPGAGTSFNSSCYSTKERDAAGCPLSLRRSRVAAPFEGGTAVTTYRVTLRDRETQTVVGYYNGTWTTDGDRAMTLRERRAAEDHAARMRDRCPRNADLIKVEEFAAAN
jgi:hypothetical protein